MAKTGTRKRKKRTKATRKLEIKKKEIEFEKKEDTIQEISPILREMKIEKEKKAGIEKEEEREKKYYVEYLGLHRHISLSGIGRVVHGQLYEIDKKRALFLKKSTDWKVTEEYV